MDTMLLGLWGTSEHMARSSFNEWTQRTPLCCGCWRSYLCHWRN